MQASVFASPSRRPKTPCKTKLSRRWSLDNVNSKEGYVKDLRKQHQSQQVGQRDEAYPFMMTEKRRSRAGSLNTTLECPRRPLSCSPPAGLLLPKRTRTMSLDEESEHSGSVARISRPKRSSVPTLRGLNKGGSSTNLATSIVPEDFEFHMEDRTQFEPPGKGLDENSTSSLFRKRSSSLPRILPPICDHDEESTDDIFEEHDSNGGFTVSLKQMDQASNLIVREMQKFVCKNATDVTQILPLPIPTNIRQQKRLNLKKPYTGFDLKHTQVLLQNLAKIHAISYSISERNSQLFQEITDMLSPFKPMKKIELDNQPALLKILEATPLIDHDINYDDVIATVKSQAGELYSNHLCPIFPVITHGQLSDLTFTYNHESEVIGVKLAPLHHTMIGSPLLDIYAAFFNGHQKDVRGLLSNYIDTFLKYAKLLKVVVQHPFSLDDLMDNFKKFELTGMILTSMQKRQQPHIALGRSCSLGGHDMLMRKFDRPLHELGNDLCKLTIENPFSHDEVTEEELHT